VRRVPPPGAEHRHTQAFHRVAEVALDVIGQAQTIEVVDHDPAVLEVLPGAAREAAVDQRLFAVGDWVADDGVAVGRGESFHF
jgi:hypothetical protein